MKEYLLKYRYGFLTTGILVFLLHSAKLNSEIIGIDTENLIRHQEGFYGGWLQTGRQGLVLLKFLFGNTQFNPYFTGIVTLVLFAASVGVFLMLWDRICGRENSGPGAGMWIFGAALWIAHPVMTEQFYFSLQSMEICMAFLLTAGALYLSYGCVEKQSGFRGAAAAALLLIAFSVYQCFVVIYIFGTVAVLLLQAVKKVSEKSPASPMEFRRKVFSYIFIFLGAFLVNMLVTRLFFDSSDYLRNQIYWKSASVKDCMRAVAEHILTVFTGSGSVFFTPGFGVLAIADLAFLVWFLRMKKASAGMGGICFFFYLSVLAAPFMMTILLGGPPAVRAQLAVPMATGFLGYLCFLLLWLLRDGGEGLCRRICLLCGMLACVFTGAAQTRVTERLYYTDRCRYEQDAAIGRDLIMRIERIDRGSGDLPIVVVGGREFHGNSACIEGEVIGRSFFDYDTEVEPAAFWSTGRVLGFLHTLGADYRRVPAERIEEALQFSDYMPEWPAEASVQEKDGMIIIKFSRYHSE